MNNKMREEFEAWWQSIGQFIRAGGGDYEKCFAYGGWQAARASRPSAPVVPDGWPTHAMIKAAKKEQSAGGNVEEILCAALAIFQKQEPAK